VFDQALTTITRRLDEAKAQGFLKDYALIGGFAVSAWGIPRATQDVDFALVLGSADPEGLSRHLDSEFLPGDGDDPLRGVFQLKLSIEDQRVPVQLILLPPRWTSIIIDGIVTLSVLGCSVPVISWEGLILLKLYAGGPQDLLDAQHIFAVRKPTVNEIEKLSKLAVQVDLLGAFRDLVDRL